MPTKLGQNFLKDTHVLKRIIEVANLSKEDTVIEIGPGKGVLTELLAKYAKRVIAIELDRHLIPDLRKKFEHTANVEIIESDILQINLPELIKRNLSPTPSQGERGISFQYKVVANIPYYITAPIIRLFLETKYPPAEMVLMVQKEVAERICGVPGEMSILAISVQYYGQPKILFEVSKNCFEPVPEVDSAVIKISNISNQLSTEEYTKKFFRIVRAGFSARRKTLANNLTNSFQFPKKIVDDHIKKLGLKLSVRAQELSLVQWKKLSEVIPLS